MPPRASGARGHYGSSISIRISAAGPCLAPCQNGGGILCPWPKSCYRDWCSFVASNAEKRSLLRVLGRARKLFHTRQITLGVAWGGGPTLEFVRKSDRLVLPPRLKAASGKALLLRKGSWLSLTRLISHSPTSDIFQPCFVPWETVNWGQ